MNVHFSQASDEWATPQDLFDTLNAEFKFTLDAAATLENAKCPRFYTKDDSGLDHSWEDERVFINPPYDRDLIKAFMRKAASGEADLVVALVPARTNTLWFHEQVLGNAEVRFIRGKLKFNGHKKQAPFPSMVCIWRRGRQVPHTVFTYDVMQPGKLVMR